jgi:hypothetical protein
MCGYFHNIKLREHLIALYLYDEDVHPFWSNERPEHFQFAL